MARAHAVRCHIAQSRIKGSFMSFCIGRAVTLRLRLRRAAPIVSACYTALISFITSKARDA
ncbi:hypothetical protein Trco_003171 [Trichoderma cornu-damae]|uniref:Uncharacterized protein n=1 Tax=Trichoderma cornu-damae TaxID=654480 RepID=A0A9P8QUA0_9HYPO|nr:hypothetical protein Trco_003171 [Trichoderma cornu-damae]